MFISMHSQSNISDALLYYRLRCSRKPQNFLLEADSSLSPPQLSLLSVKLHLYICSGIEVSYSLVFYPQQQCLLIAWGLVLILESQ